MRSIAIVLLALTLLASGCKNSKEAKAKKQAEDMERFEEQTAEAERISQAPAPDQTSSTEPVADASAEDRKEQVDLEKYKPVIADDQYFGMYRTPCFGKCPYYNLDINLDGTAVLEGKKFFDYIGFYTTTLNEDQMNMITTLAKKYGYFALDHVYDAPVTDLPSTTTFLRTESGVQWVYNRMEAPEGLNKFQMEVETLIKDLQWEKMEVTD